MNYNIPQFRAVIRKSYFTKDERDDDDWYDVVCFALQSIAGKMLTFHVMTDHGMLRSRVPLSSICFNTSTPYIPFHYKQLWDCFGEEAHIVTYDFLKYKRCQVVLKDRSKVWAEYLFTIDWFNNSYSEQPEDYKCGHLLKGDDGSLLCMPNNRIQWSDSNWVTKELPTDLSIFKVDTELLSVENNCDRWVSEDSDCYYYNLTLPPLSS